MIAIAVDDEILMLGALVKAVDASPDIREVNKFSDCDEALDFVKKNPVDIVLKQKNPGNLFDEKEGIPEIPVEVTGRKAGK